MNDMNLIEIFCLYFNIYISIYNSLIYPFLKEKFVSKRLSNEFFIVYFQRISKVCVNKVFNR